MEIKKMKEELAARFDEAGEFIYLCCNNDNAYCENQSEVIHKLWRKAADFEGFLNLLKNVETEFAVNSQAWGELAKRAGWDIPFLDVVANISVMADGGNVKIGSLDGSFSVGLPNGYGDGCFTVFIVEKRSLCKRNFNAHMMDYIGSIDGKFQIYTYDCQENCEVDNEERIFEGRYMIYAHKGTVVLEKY